MPMENRLIVLDEGLHMKRALMGVAACWLVFAAAAHAQTPAEMAVTARYLAAFQNPDGGFSATPGGASSLPATSSAIRSLKNVGGSIPDVLGVIRFIKSCYVADPGGFAPVPGGKVDVSTTASGLMALVEMKITDEAMVEKSLKFFSENAKSFEEVRIAVAGLEAVKKTLPNFPEWTAEVLRNQGPSGVFGEGVAMPRETGGRGAALLRMGVTLEKKDAILKALRDTQRSDGGWGKTEETSELETTYRIARLFFMLREKPDLDRLATLIARCRHANGGYGVHPGAEPSIPGTYFATTVARWIRLLNGEPELVETAGFQPLFNGKDLTGWEGDRSLWSAAHGMLVGQSAGLKHNDFLATEASFGSFVFKATFRMTGGAENSGIQFRSVRVPGHEMSGFQADIGQNYWGCLYDESRRNKVLEKASDAAVKKINHDGWNHYVIDAKGDDIRLALNGVTSVMYHETDPAIPREGKFAVQLHAGGPFKMEFKDLYIQPVPEPRADSTNTPGFHLRTLSSDQGDRKYTVYIPRDYDGKREFPLVLFLHGSGERGEDGVKQAQVGLGPAVLAAMDRFPAIAVFPQARRTWAADSDDARAALAALDAEIKALKVDTSRLILTGLSMGGSGSWSIAEAHPDRFAAVVPICGRGKPDAAKTLAKLPIWTIVGDADRDETVLNGRAMTEALLAAGGKARLTEYRGVGHNSWDRAYNDPSIIDWMLAQARH